MNLVGFSFFTATGITFLFTNSFLSPLYPQLPAVNSSSNLDTKLEPSTSSNNSNKLNPSPSRLFFIKEDEEFCDEPSLLNEENLSKLPKTNSSFNQTNIKRNESEFSLGFNRNPSLAGHLYEYGEFCQSGQFFIFLLRYASYAFLGSFLIHNISIHFANNTNHKNIG